MSWMSAPGGCGLRASALARPWRDRGGGKGDRYVTGDGASRDQGGQQRPAPAGEQKPTTLAFGECSPVTRSNRGGAPADVEYPPTCRHRLASSLLGVQQIRDPGGGVGPVMCWCPCRR